MIVTRVVSALMILVFVLQQFLPLDALMLWPGERFHIWQWITFNFLHVAWWHLALNLLAFYTIGSEVEKFLGSFRYAHYLMFCAAGAAIFQEWLGPDLPALGMSGVVFGLLTAYACFHPKRRVWLLVIPMQAFWAMIAVACLTIVLIVTGAAGGVGHWAHLGGMLGGFVTLCYWLWKEESCAPE